MYQHMIAAYRTKLRKAKDTAGIAQLNHWLGHREEVLRNDGPALAKRDM
jgi:hypothetical protein